MPIIIGMFFIGLGMFMGAVGKAIFYIIWG